MTKKELLESIRNELEKIPDSGSFVFGYCVGDKINRASMGDPTAIVFLCELIKIDAFNGQVKKENK